MLQMVQCLWLPSKPMLAAASLIPCIFGAGITFGGNLLPVLLRELLVDKAEHSVALYEGSGASWKRTK